MHAILLFAIASLVRCTSGWPVAVASPLGGTLVFGRDEHYSSYSTTTTSTANAATSTTAAAADADPSWVAPPQQRGTWQLIVGCLTTLSLCAWTVYHPNVSHNRSMASKFKNRLRWMVSVVLLPELVLFIALKQRWAASRLREEVNQIRGRAVAGFEEPLVPPKKDKCVIARSLTVPNLSSQASTLQEDCSVYSSSSHVVASQPSDNGDGAQSGFMRFSLEDPERARHHHGAFVQQLPQNTAEPSFTPWTRPQAFFAVCGGLAVETGSFWDSPNLTLTPLGLMVLARAGLLPHFTHQEVTEKSKANTVAKIMVCIQVSWFLVQAVARLAQKLPLTLLELHVLTHVLCALAMYFCWVDKPYDAETPIVIRDEKIKDLVALFILDATADIKMDFQDRLTRQISMAEIREQHMRRRPKSTSSCFKLMVGMRQILGYVNYSKVKDFMGISDQVEHKWLTLEQLERSFELWAMRGTHYQPTPEQIARMREHLKRANRGLDYLRSRYFQSVACRGDSEIPREPQVHFGQQVHFRQHGEYGIYVVAQQSNICVEGSLESCKSAKMRANLASYIILVGYGAAHLCAWNEHFPSTIECWMWRVASLCMVSCPLALEASGSCLILWSKMRLQDKWNRTKWQYLSRRIAWNVAAFVVLRPVFLAAAAGLVCGRAFVLCESLVSLRSPPVGTYRIPEWSNYWPHVG